MFVKTVKHKIYIRLFSWIWKAGVKRTSFRLLKKFYLSKFSPLLCDSVYSGHWRKKEAVSCVWIFARFVFFTSPVFIVLISTVIFEFSQFSSFSWKKFEEFEAGGHEAILVFKCKWSDRSYCLILVNDKIRWPSVHQKWSSLWWFFIHAQLPIP